MTSYNKHSNNNDAYYNGIGENVKGIRRQAADSGEEKGLLQNRIQLSF